MADWPAKKNATFTVTFPIFDNDGDLVTAAASLDSEVSKDKGTFTDCTNEATELATSSGMYYLDLTADEMNADIVATITKTSTSDAKTAPNVMYTATRQLVDLAYPATSGRSLGVETDGHVHADLKEWLGTAPLALTSQQVQVSVAAMAAGVVTAAAVATDAIDADAIADNAIDAAAIAANAITAGKIATDAFTNAKFAADAIGASELSQAAVDQVWSSATRNLTALGFVLAAADVGTDAIGAAELATDAVQEIRDAILSDSTPFAGAAITEARLSELDAGTGGKMAAEVDIVKKGTVAVSGAVDDVAATTTDFDTDGFTEASNDHFNGSWMIFTSGALAGQGRMITDYVGTGQNCVFDRAWSEAPAENDEFVILAVPSSALSTLLGRIADVEGMAAATANRSLLWAIAKLANKVDASTTTVAIKKTDDSTNLFTQTATEDSGADPITVLDTV